MARTSNLIDSKTKRQSKALKPRREPYWHRLSAGCHLGYRKLAEGEGTWIAKYRDGQTGERSIRSLGTIIDAPGAPAFDVARKLAQQWFDELIKGVDPEPKTVREACVQYAKSIGAEGSPRGQRAEQDFKRLVYDDALAKVDLFRLREKHVEEWRQRMESVPARVGRSKRTKDTPRTPATINRDLVSLRAALNLAHQKGQVASDRAWKNALKPLGDADGQRMVYLTREQRQRLLEVSTADVRPFFRALALLPLRPGAVATLTVRDFDRRHSVLTIRKDKGAKQRSIKLPAGLVSLFVDQAKDKLPSASLFTQANGSPWNRNEWGIKMREAVAAAALPTDATLYALRHSTITDLVTDNRLDLLTIAQLAGTSVKMIEKHYGHLRKENAAQALEILAL